MKLPKLVHGSWFMVHGLPQTKNRKPRTKNSKSAGFTLIELLVVMSIIAILVAAATVSWTNAQQKTRDAKRKSDLKAVQQALELYFQRIGNYPITGAGGAIRCTTDLTVIAWGGSFTCSNITYMNPVPKDPINSGNFTYFYELTGLKQYKLSARLENTNDREYCDPATTNCVLQGILPCQPPADKTYCVIQP